MARRKLEKVPDYLKAHTRSAALKSIDPALDLGNGMTLTSYTSVLTEFENALHDYNTLLSTVDEKYNTCLEKLDLLRDWNERMLSGVASKYGKTSSQYEMAGGTRKQDRKKPGNTKQ